MAADVSLSHIVLKACKLESYENNKKTKDATCNKDIAGYLTTVW